MQESEKPTNNEFWKVSPEGDDGSFASLGEDKELEVSQLKARFRHRVVGAIVLVAALVTVLPVLFEEPAIQSDKHALTTIPPIAKEPFYKMELPVNERPKVSMPNDASALKDLSKPNEVTEAPEARPTPELDQAKEVAKTYAPTTEGSLYIQVLATSSEAGAMKVMSDYQAMGLPVYSVKVQKKSATIWRVRLGLFKTRAEAEEVAKLLDAKKISHLPVQVEATAKENMNRIAPVRTLKSTVQEVHSRTEEKKSQAAPIVKAAPVKVQPKASEATKKTTSQTKPKTVKKETPKAAPASAAKPVSADPLADLLKSTREQDVIAQKLREARQ